MEASVAIEPEKRMKSTPLFRVFREVVEDPGSDMGGSLWELLTEDEAVPAPSGKAAVRAVVGDEGGRFFTIPDSQFDPKIRKFEEEPQPKVKEIWE